MRSGRIQHHYSLEQFFQLLVQGLAGIGFAMLLLAGQISPLAAILFGIAYAMAFHPRFFMHGIFSAAQVNSLSWFYLPVFLGDMFFGSHSFVSATLHLILAMLLLKIYQEKADRDYFQIILLTFLLVLAASSLTINFSFFLGFLLFLLTCLAALITFEIRRNLRSQGQTDNKIRLGPARTPLPTKGASSYSEMQPLDGRDSPLPRPAGSQCNFPLAEQSKAGRAIFLLSFLSMAAITAGSTLFFFALPRFGTGYFSRVQNRFSALSGFNDQIRLGGIGRIQLDTSVVMRIQVLEGKRLSPETRWRGVALDYFDGRSWMKRVRAKPVYFPSSRQFSIQEPLGPGEKISYQVLMEPGDTNYIFTLRQIIRLEGKLFPLVYDPADQSLLARPHANQRLGYRGDSWREKGPVPPEKQIPLSNLYQAQYLQLPSLDNRIPALARQVAGTGDSAAQAVRIEQYFQKNFTYSLDAADLDRPQPLPAFLFESRKGHCEYFATAMAVLLRTLGIPSRVVNGFQPGEFNEVAEDYIIRGSDAHSWVEAFLPERGWQPFDPTPGSTIPPQRSAVFKALYSYWDALELFWGQWILPYDDVLQASLFSDLQSLSLRWGHQGRNFFQERLKNGGQSLWDQLRKATTHFNRHWILWAVLLVLASLIVWGFFFLRRFFSWRIFLVRSQTQFGTSRAIQIYRKMLYILRKKGKLKPPELTPREFSESIPEPELKALVTSLTTLYNQIRFSKMPASMSQMQSACRQLQNLRHYRPR